MRDRATFLGWRNPDRHRGGGPDKGPTGPAGTSQVPGVGMVRHVQPPEMHDLRTIRCAPEGHFFAMTGRAETRLTCDCGAATVPGGIVVGGRPLDSKVQLEEPRYETIKKMA